MLMLVSIKQFLHKLINVFNIMINLYYINIDIFVLFIFS